MSPAVLTMAAALAAAVAAALSLPGRARPGATVRRVVVAGPSTPVAPGRRLRWLWSLLAGVGAGLFLGGTLGTVAVPVIGVVAWVVLGRSEPAGLRRERERVREDLPHLVTLFGAALRSGAAPAEAMHVVCTALPGPAATRLLEVAAPLGLGADPALVWESLAHDPVLGVLGRTLARSHSTGAAVVPAVERLADDLARLARSQVEERARGVGVAAALPLGLCLLPSFLLLGIVPLVVALLAGLAL